MISDQMMKPLYKTGEKVVVLRDERSPIFKGLVRRHEGEFLGNGIVIKPNHPWRFKDNGEDRLVMHMQPVVKMVRHGKVSVINDSNGFFYVNKNMFLEADNLVESDEITDLHERDKIC